MADRAHRASQISVADAGNDFTATDVEGVLAELQADAETDDAALAAHIGDASDAHDASAISFSPTGSISSTNVQSALAEVASEGGGGGTGSYTFPETIVRFSEIFNTDDSTTLANFCTTNANANFKATLMLDELRDYTFTTQQMIYPGFSMIGGNLRALDQARSANTTLAPYGQKVRIRMTTGNGWLRTPATGTIFGIYMAGLTFDGSLPSGDTTGRNRLFAVNTNTAAVMWTSTFRDISYQNGPGIFGSPTVVQRMDGCVFSGFWNVNNIQDETLGTAFNIGGSDNRYNAELLLIDAPTSIMSPDGVLMTLGHMSKSTLRNVYMTCEEHMGLVITGGNDQMMMRIDDCEFEGRNVDEPCFGAIVRISGADVMIHNSWISYGMFNPASVSGGASENRGVIHIKTGSHVLLDGITYRNATGVAATTNSGTPFVYVETGATLRICNIFGSGDNRVPFTPLVKASTGATIKTSDDSVTVVTF